MNSPFNLSFAIALASIACAGHFFQAVCGFPSMHTASSYRTNHNNIDNNDHITIDFPLSPSVQSPTIVTYIQDNNQYQTLHSNGHSEGGHSILEGTDTLSSEDDRTSSSQRNGNNNNNNLQTVSGHHQVFNEGHFDTFHTNQAAFPSTRPTNIPIGSLLKRLTQLIERRRNRQRRIQSFRRAILQGTGRSVRTGQRRIVGHHGPNLAQARRIALQSLRRRIRT